jgi:chromosome segregation ATPase
MSLEKQLAKCEGKLADLVRQHQDALTSCEEQRQAIDAYSRQREQDTHTRYIEQQQEADEAYDTKIARIRQDHQQNLADALARKNAAIKQLQQAHDEYLVGVDSLTSEKNRKRQTIAAKHTKRLTDTRANHQAMQTALNSAQQQAENSLTGHAIQPLPILTAQLKSLVATLHSPLANLAEREIALRESLTGLAAAEQAEKRHLKEESQKLDAKQTAIIAHIDTAQKDAKNQLNTIRRMLAPLTSAKPKGTKAAVNIGSINDALQQLQTCKAAADGLGRQAGALYSEWEITKRQRRWRVLIVTMVLLGVLLAAYAVITGTR